MNRKWDKEPWRIGVRGDYIATADDELAIYVDEVGGHNASRIVACVNAMKDVPDPAAFVEAVKEFIRDHYGSLRRDGPDTMIARNFARFIDMELPT